MAEFDPELPSVVPSSGKEGARHSDDRNAIVAALELLNGGGTPDPNVVLIVGDGVEESVVKFINDADKARWNLGRAPDNHFLLRRYDADGIYASTPLFVAWETGFVYLEASQIASPSGSVTPLLLVHGSTTPDEAYFKITDSSGAVKLQVNKDGCLEITPGIGVDDAITKGQVKDIVAASTDFADFKSRIAAW